MTKVALISMVAAAAISIPAIAAPSNTQFEQCKSKLIKAQKLNILYQFDIERQRPKIVVGPTFFQLPIDAKEGFADTLNCFLVGGEQGTYIPFNLLHWQTGKRVARYSSGKLEME